VDALGGEPGIFSSRYAGPDADDAERIRFLLRKLEGVPTGQRSARFRCAIALATPNKAIQTAEGTCEGEIAFTPRGHHGFGYDPIFFLPKMGRTMAELTPDEKNQISHRARALENMRPLLLEAVRQGRCSS
jgi:XTP/dITP diphosphohydrolase